MGFLHEIVIAIGVALMVVLTCSVSILAREYAKTGCAPLAIVSIIERAAAHGGGGVHCTPHLHAAWHRPPG